MITLKFVGTEKQQEFAAVLQKKVFDYFKENRISTKGNLTLVVQTIIMFAIYIVPFIVIITTHINILLAILMTVLMGIGLAGIGMCVMHDAVHNAYSKKKWVNKIMGFSMYLLGANVFNWKIQHNYLHHAFTNIDGYDQDISSKGPIRASQHAPFRKIHRYQHIHIFFFYGLLTISKLVKDFRQLAEFNRTGYTQQHHINPAFEYVKMVFRKIIYLLVIIGLPLLITRFYWWQILLGFIIMHWVAGFLLSTFFQMAHVVEGAEQPLPNSDGVIDNEWVVHELRTASDFNRNSLFLNWYIGGLNFQIEHHLFPGICHVHYRKIAPIVEKTAKEFGYNYNLKPNFIKAFRSHLRRLKELEKTEGQN
jgi:linoleoyl-CoA desaturase